MMLQEVDMMKSFDHSAIPRIVDIINTSEYLAIVMDYVEGETLDNIVKEYGAQPVEKVIEWAKQLCDVLGYLHSLNPPHIYRDMKPANVMLQPNGKIKIIDFGIMCTYKPNQNSDTCYLGTKGYAAPDHNQKPKGLEYIISKCTALNPNDRYRNCDELLSDLNQYQDLPKQKCIFKKLFKLK